MNRKMLLSWLALGCFFILLSVPILHIGLGEDEGVFAMQALRLVQGQLPVVDFPIAYMGGNVFYNALWFLLLGQSFWALRVGLLLIFGFLGWGIFYVARRILSPAWAILTTLSVLGLVVGSYPYLNASWNALLFSFMAFILFVKGLEAEAKPKPHQKLWFLGAGVAIALAMFMKQTVGLYTAFSLYGLQLLNLAFPLVPSQQRLGKPKQQLLAKIGMIAGSFLILGYLVFLLKPHAHLHVLLFFGVPIVGMLLILWRSLLKEATYPAYHHAMRNLFLVGLGGFLTLAVLLIPYALRGQLGEYLYNVFIFRPSFYLKMFYQDYILAIQEPLVAALFFFVGGVTLIPRTRIWGGLCALVGVLFFMKMSINSYQDWQTTSIFTLYQFPLWLIGIGLVYFYRKIQSKQVLEQKTWLALAVWIWGSFLYLNTYPVIAMAYVACNLAPLGIFMGYLCERQTQRCTGIYKAPFILFMSYWAVYGTMTLYQYKGQSFSQFLTEPFRQYTAYLPMPHGGLYLTEDEFQKRQPLIDFIDHNIPETDDFYILADSSPEVYFLTGRRNPTRYDYYLFSFADGTQDLINTLAKNQVRYIFLEPSRRPVFGVKDEVLTFVDQHYHVKRALPNWLILERSSP